MAVALVTAAPLARTARPPTFPRRTLRTAIARAEANQNNSSTLEPAAVNVETPRVRSPKTPGFSEVFAFNGPAPEVINGRLAMLGFLAALGAELASGQRVTEQLAAGGSSILAAFVVFAAASLVPIFNGAINDEAFGPLTPTAELFNGRAAMLGFAALLVIEALKGSALF